MRAGGEVIKCRDEKQLLNRLPAEYVEQILSEFNSGKMDAWTAQERLGVSRARLYVLRHQWLKEGILGISGGDRKSHWPQEILDFVEGFLPHCEPLNYALIADELLRKFHFERSARSVARLIDARWPEIVERLPKGPKPRRRWQCASIGELLQHDTSPHGWWPAPRYPILILTLDDHSRKILAGKFIEEETSWNHFCHFRKIFEQYGLPNCVYTDGLAVFGRESMRLNAEDICSQFQRAMRALNVAHRVAPDAPAKGKIERRFGYFQKRLVTLLRAEHIQNYDDANTLLQEHIQFYNQKHTCRTTQLTPNQSWEKSLNEKRSLWKSTPDAALLDLHLALYLRRKLNSDHTIDFLGNNYPVAATPQKNVTIVHHPERKFWVIPHPPKKNAPIWPTILASHSL